MIDYIHAIEKVSDAVIVDYQAVYYVDLATNEYVRFSEHDELPGSCREPDFFTSRRKDAEQFVHEEDRERFARELSKEALIRAIQNCSRELTEYRLMAGHSCAWHSVSLIRGEYGENNKYAILGVRNIDETKRKTEELLLAEREKEKLTQIASALANIFDSIYYINLEDNSFIEFSSSEDYKKIRTTDSGKDFFDLAKPLLCRYIHPNDEKKITCIYNKDEMLQAVNGNKGAYSAEYRFIVNGAAYYCRAAMRLTRDGSHMLVSIANLGKEENIERKLQESQRLSVTYSQIAERLAEHYDNIYYVNISTNEYMTFSSMKLLSDLDRTERENNFFENVVKDINRLIYPDDRAAVLEFFDKERLIANLKRQNAMQLEYRLLINDEPNFVKLTAMLTKDREKLLLCVENINDQMVQYMSLTKKATCDELTGAKNKNAYQDFERELNEQIAAGKAEFAILVCDINNLKTINDTMGHKDGDDYIKSACRLICNTFVHSPVFRVGGDEFAAILRGDDYAHRKKLFEALRRVVKYNAAFAVSPDKPVIASGMCAYAAGEHKKAADVFNAADQMMYENKKLLKSGGNAEPR